jgi:hypothetical protein
MESNSAASTVRKIWTVPAPSPTALAGAAGAVPPPQKSPYHLGPDCGHQAVRLNAADDLHGVSEILVAGLLDRKILPC